MTRNSNVHAVLNQLDDAFLSSDYKVCLLPLNTNVLGWYKNDFRCLCYFDFVLSHFAFLISLFRLCKSDLVVVREFLTLPLLLVWPFVFFIRKKVVFIVNHNLQKAEESSVQRLAFKSLVFFGARFAFLESNIGCDIVGISESDSNHLVFPIPLLSPVKRAKTSFDGCKYLGVIGEIRAEKDSYQLINKLCEDINSDLLSGFKIIIGAPNIGKYELEKNDKIILIDTSTNESFHQAISMCYGLVLNYRKEDYFHRSSGVVVDAMSHSTLCFAPDYPVLRDQLTSNGVVGYLYSDFDDIASVVKQSLINEHSQGFEQQFKYRSVSNVSRLVDDYVSGLNS